MIDKDNSPNPRRKASALNSKMERVSLNWRVKTLPIPKEVNAINPNRRKSIKKVAHMLAIFGDLNKYHARTVK
jgi:hypothetical protein